MNCTSSLQTQKRRERFFPHSVAKKRMKMITLILVNQWEFVNLSKHHARSYPDQRPIEQLDLNAVLATKKYYICFQAAGY
jgi:hypothetical protein